MSMRWDLAGIYRGFDDRDFKEDREKFRGLLEKLENWEIPAAGSNTEQAESFLQNLAGIYEVYTMLSAFSHLTVSVDARNEEALKIIEELEKEAARLTGPRVRFQKWLSGLDDPDSLINGSPFLREHNFFLKELIEKEEYLLSEQEETLVSELVRTGSSAWTKLQEKLTSTLMVEVELDGTVKPMPLPEARNLAFKKDPAIRRSGYEAELKAYKKIEEPVAAALNGIKGEVLTITERRGFTDPLDETLLKSRMERETLQTMLEAMQDALPTFRDFYRTKARLLNRDNNLPFYDLFAPLGEVVMEFTLEEARDFIIEHISGFSPEMAGLYQRAFSGNWIDAEPREGKRGGAFCYNIIPVGESRILSNFTGSFSDMTTLAHELGHAYHGYCLEGESILNTGYPMPLAETASIFSETIVTHAALRQADAEQSFAILENRISQAGQVIVDIYSRYIFEKNLFAGRKKASLSVEELKDLMLRAQKEAYGDALDPELLHPYAWLNKPHYYSAGTNFYNFPYAFGLLFGLGIYALSLERGNSFLADYKKLLKATGKNKALEVAKMVGIDLNNRTFWDNSLAVVKNDIKDFLDLAERSSV